MKRKYVDNDNNDNKEKSITIQRVVINQMSEYIRLWGEQRVVTTSQNLQDNYLTIVKNALDSERIDSAESYNNIGITYYNQGDYGKALEYQFRVLKIREKELGIDHPDTATTYNNIADVYRNTGDYEIALEYYDKARVIREMKLGREHINTATTYYSIGMVYYAQGDFDNALEFLNKAYLIFNKIVGSDHFDTKEILNKILILNKLSHSAKV